MIHPIFTTNIAEEGIQIPIFSDKVQLVIQDNAWRRLCFLYATTGSGLQAQPKIGLSSTVPT